MESVQTTQDTSTEEQGHGSALAIEPKDNEQVKTERRTFLKRAGIATGALCTPGLPKLAAAEPKEPDKSLNEEIAQLEPEEKEALVTLLKGLWEVDRMLTPGLVKYYLLKTRGIVERQETKVKKEKAKQEDHNKRNKLTGQAKVDYLVSQLTEDCQFYSPPFQREILELVAKGTPSQSDWKTCHDIKVYLIGGVNKTFEGCSKRLCQKVIAQYFRDVLPAHEERYNQEAEELQACDELLVLTEGKTPQQIRDMTTLLKSLS